MHIDWGFHAGDVVLTIIGGVITLMLRPLFKLLVEMRDSLRGLVVRVESHDIRIDKIEEMQASDHDTIIKVEARCPLVQK